MMGAPMVVGVELAVLVLGALVGALLMVAFGLTAQVVRRGLVVAALVTVLGGLIISSVAQSPG